MIQREPSCPLFPFTTLFRARPLAVALTGGIAAGKSEALAAFARRGAATASADAIVHDLLASDPEARDAIRQRWGEIGRAHVSTPVTDQSRKPSSAYKTKSMK